MKPMLVVVAAIGMMSAAAVYAQSGADVVKGKCVACHDVEKKKVGPSFKDAAAKYKGKKGAAEQLAGALKEGKGHPKVAASDAELKVAVEHALATK